MAIRAGALRHRVTIQQPVETPDGFGEPVVTWTDVVTVHAEKLRLSGNERQNASVHQEVAQELVHFRMRYRSDIEPKWRLVWESKNYDIIEAQDVDGRKVELVIIATRDNA